MNKAENENKLEENELVRLIHTRIEKLRPKLLDLTRRNPLLSTKFSDRSHSHIRIVDELPQVLFESMSSGSMEFIPLPPLDEEPKDERTQEFQNALYDARLTDEIYINKLESIDQDSEDSVDQLAVAERELKDRLRERFGLHPIQTRTNLTLVHHAINHHIRPQYELPLPSEAHPDGRHEDNLIQTLLLQDLFERRLNSLLNKCNTWIQETGIHVLKSAYGFLEWKESPTSDPSLAPLILLPVEIEKEKTKSGYKYSVFGQGESAETNTVLVEKMKHDFGLEFPVFDSEQMTVEDYFKEVVEIELQGRQLVVRRQVAIGVFPSAKMAMYYDLDTTMWEFAEHEVIKDLLGGAGENTTETPFGDEYEVDDPKIEARVPNLIMDADSSQFSTIVDVMNKKNIAVEGPPGTGKSQTIVNTIAAAISAGKKVLFVAEKMAALEVVRSRLEACGLGEFLLTLQANRSSKSKVIQSIRDRMSLPYEIEPSGLEERIDRLRRTRSELKEYINIMSSVFSETNFTVHDILGWGISARDKLSKHSQNLLECKVSNLKAITKEILNEIIDVSNQFETAFKRNLTFKQHWSFIKRANIDPYSAEEILKLAQNASKSCNDSNLLRGKLTSMKLSKGVDHDELIKFKNCLNEIEGYSENIDIELVEKLSNWVELYNGALKKIDIFFKDKEDTLLIYERFQSIYSNPLDEGLSKTLVNLAKIVNEMGLQNLKINTAEEISEKINSELLGMQKEMEVVSEAGKVKGFLLNKTIQAVVTACDIGSTSQRSVLAMRKETLEPALVKVVIMKSSETCNSLRQKKEELEKDYYIETFDKDEIDCNCEVFIKSGLFAIFSSKYRIAKRSYLSISKDKKFRKAKAINQSKVISRWLEKLKGFNETGGLLEDSFDGLETNYKLLEELMNYYDQIDTKLSGVENKEIREFLKRGDIDLILALPEIDPDHTIRKSNYSTYEALSAVANQIKVKKEKFKGYIKDLEDLVSVFVDYKYVDVNLLSEARNELGTFQEKWRSLNDNAELKELLGNYFKGIETDRKEIQTSIDMASKIVYLGSELGNAMTLIFKDESISESIVKLESIINTDLKFEEEISKLAKLVNVKSEEIILSRSKQELSAFLNEAANNKEGLMAFSIVHANRLAFHSRGLGSIIDNLLLPEGKIDGLADIVVAVIGQLLAREVYKEYGNVLVSYDGSKLNHLRQTFAKLDKDIIGLSRKKLRVLLKKNSNPPNGIGQGKRSEWTDMCLLHNEMSKQKRHIPARDLTKRAGAALLEIKPCWMMSPLAVAQYIDKDDIEFDLAIIDEASQMTPEDAIGALARCKQAMIVGDTNQLPPSNFFKKFIDVMDEDEDEIVTEESILEMANAVFRPARRLKWHYRSKHPGLIAFSNKYVYNSDLIVFPSPRLDNKKQGVSLKSVNGLYKSGTNPIESTEIVKATIGFMHKNKDMSLGIVVLNQKQRDLLLEEIEYAISNDSVASDYIDHWETYNDGLERFFVKNLENVQGDERDVIFIGTVYGPEKEGAPVMQRFGPINGIAGKRRLNVLFSRAKHKIITFSSMNSNDIRVNEGGNEGVELLKHWLEYSVTGKLLEAESTYREPGSEFEAYVIAQLKAIGCQTVPQVGVTGYFIDIGIKHPDWPHGFVMGVECDGATYHSSKSARDRDRLRQEVLEGLGWYLHRIWSTDWFNDPLSEAERLREVVECRLIELKSGQEHKPHIDNSKKSPSTADNDELPISSSQDDDSKIINNVSVLQKEIFLYIEENGNATVLDTANSFSIKPARAKMILNELIKSNLICKDESGDKVYYSTNTS